MKIEKHNIWLWCIVLVGLLLTALFSYSHKIDGDVIQVLRNGHALVEKGVLIPYGNASSSGSSGNVPGAFSSLVVGLPMLIYNSPWSSLLLMTLLHLGALYLCYQSLSEYLSHGALLAFAVFFWLSPWRLSEVFLWNPGYIYVASALHMWSAWKLSKSPSFLFSIVHALSIFLALQIHASFVILVFMTFLLLWMRALKPNWWGALTGVVLGMASLLPYILAGLKDPSIFPHPGSGGGKGYLFFGFVNVYPLLKGFMYWIRFSTPVFQTHMFQQFDFSWIGVSWLEKTSYWTWQIIKYAVGLYGFYISFWANIRFFKLHRSEFNVRKARMNSAREWPVFYSISAFVAAMLAVGIAPTLPIYWHLLFVWPFALIPLFLILDKKEEREKKKIKWTTFCLFFAIYFSVYNFFGALGSKKHDIRNSLDNRYHQVCTDECRLETESL
ncbi:MAG: hypothetical protein KDD50_14180 [Bdellovibrionales bacterium]|nr:hypothetical protein [Bdellovibrionales bacterium]